MKGIAVFLLLSSISCYVQIEAAILPTPVQVKGCVDNGHTYKPGETFKPNPCNYCQCGDDGRVHCAIMDCAMPACFDAVRAPDQCCPVCPNGANCRAPDGTIIQAGKQVTLANGAICSCPNGGSHWGFWNNDAICAIQAVTSAPIRDVFS